MDGLAHTCGHAPEGPSCTYPRPHGELFGRGSMLDVAVREPED
jgi:hypothetical protein